MSKDNKLDKWIDNKIILLKDKLSKKIVKVNNYPTGPIGNTGPKGSKAPNSNLGYSGAGGGGINTTGGYSPLNMNFSGIVYVSHSGGYSGYPYDPDYVVKSALDKYYECMDKDKRPDFEKSYDLYVKTKAEEAKDGVKEDDPKKMFIDAARIAFAMGKLRNE